MALLLLAALASSLAAQSFDHSLWNEVVNTYVSQIGEVDYGALKANRKGLDEYVRKLGEASPANRTALFPTKAHELAYWINAYNAFVMRGVIDGYPMRSVRDQGTLYGFFRRQDYVAGDVRMSLRHLEFEILLSARFAEPRVHFAIVCASLSCPKLSRDAFTAENLEPQLDRLARQFVNERRNLTIDASGGVTLSSIFDWYKKDFERGESGRKRTVLDFIRRYANEHNRNALDGLKRPEVNYYEYDWSINDPGSRARARSALERELSRPGNE